MANNWLRIVDFVLWVTVVTGVIVGIFTLFSLISGGLLTLKYILFVVGFLLFGVASIGLQPKRPHRDEKIFTTDSNSEYGFEEGIQKLPPLQRDRLPIEDRVSRDKKLFVTSLVILGISYFLEVGLNITVGT